MNAELNEADTETTNVTKLIAVTKKYTCIDELTPVVLNGFVAKIVVHEREKKCMERTPMFIIPMSGFLVFPPRKKCRKWKKSTECVSKQPE